MKIIKDISIIVENSLSMGFGLRDGVLLFLLSLVTTLMEIFGVTMFLPIFQFVRLNGDIHALIDESAIWEYMMMLFNFIGIDVTLHVLLIIAFFLLSSRQIINYIRLIYIAYISSNLSRKLRNKIFFAYLNADTSFHDNLSTGELVNVVVTETRAAISGVILPIELVLNFVLLLSYLFVLLALSLEMTIAALIVLLIAIYIPKRWVNQTADTGRKVVEANSQLTEFLVERLKSPRLVRLSGTEDAESHEYFLLTKNQMDKAMITAKLMGKTSVVLEPIIIGFSLVFIYVSFSIINMSIEVMGLYLLIILRLTPVTKGIVVLWQSIQYVLGPIETVKQRLVSMHNAVEIDDGTEDFLKFNKNIELINIEYRHPGARKIALKGVNLKITQGSFVAIVGPSGSGKSTLIDILSRLRRPINGEMLIDNNPVEKYTLKSIRNSISYAPQNPQIFNGTIKNHIGYGKSNASELEIVYASKISDADSFIQELPEKYNTLITEDALNFSGGQKQRLDLARALVKKSQILILDEPTSNLDAESTKIFNESLKKILDTKEVTVIVVTHYFKDIIDADKIFVMNNGTISSEGKHADLIKIDNWYNKSWKIQDGRGD